MNMKNIKAGAIAEGAVITALTVLFLIMARYVPMFSVFSAFFAGIPMAYLVLRRHPAVAAISMAAVFSVMFIITGDLLSVLLLCVINLLPGFVLGICFLKNISFYKTLFFVSGAVAAGILLNLVIINYSAAGHGIEDIIASILQSVEQMLNVFAENMKEISPERGAELTGAVKNLLDMTDTMIRTFIPSFIIIASISVGYIISMTSVFVLRRTVSNCEIEYLPFCKLKAPKSMCYAAVVLFLIVSFTASDDILTAALNNMVAIMYFFIGVCGLSFLDSKLKKKISSGYLRFAVYAGAFVIGYLFITVISDVLIFIGMADGLMDFRQLKKRGEEHVDGE